ncbi:MAG: hypothetical protein GY762_06555 [Proteobacteria bacterium]|nr:hypothetical protein [Pseudomonadota bacterium]
MQRRSLKQMAEEENDFISGIHNYCDRWCERCPYTARCMNYAIGEEVFADPESRDIQNEKFWQSLSDLMQESMELLHEILEERGIEIDPEEMDAGIEEEEQLRIQVQEHPLSEATMAYAQEIDAWFEQAQPYFEKKEESLNDFVRLNIGGTEAERQAVAISDAVEIIYWYQFLIHVKLMRALSGLFEEVIPELEEFPRDSDGSAKIALIAIDHSIAAWLILLNAFPAVETGTLERLAQLQRFRIEAERLFPDARKFVRPGFDDMDSI